MKLGEEIRIDCFGDERFWYVDHAVSSDYNLVKYIDFSGTEFVSHRAFVMTVAQYEQSCRMREQSKQFNYGVLV